MTKYSVNQPVLFQPNHRLVNTTLKKCRHGILATVLGITYADKQVTYTICLGDGSTATSTQITGITESMLFDIGNGLRARYGNCEVIKRGYFSNFQPLHTEREC